MTGLSTSIVDTNNSNLLKTTKDDKIWQGGDQQEGQQT